MFQATTADRDDTKKLVQTLNSRLGAAALPKEILAEAYRVWWPKLDRQLKSISKSGKPSKEKERPDREILEEVLAAIRTVQHLTFADRAVLPPTPAVADLISVLPADLGKQVGQVFEIWDHVRRFVSAVFASSGTSPVEAGVLTAKLQKSIQARYPETVGSLGRLTIDTLIDKALREA